MLFRSDFFSGIYHTITKVIVAISWSSISDHACSVFYTCILLWIATPQPCLCLFGIQKIVMSILFQGLPSWRVCLPARTQPEGGFLFFFHCYSVAFFHHGRIFFSGFPFFPLFSLSLMLADFFPWFFFKTSISKVTNMLLLDNDGY